MLFCLARHQSTSKGWVGVVVALSTTVFLSAPCAAYEGHAKSKSGNLSVTYKVDDGYKISVRIDTNTKKAAYSASLKTDVLAIKVDFVDVNKDGLEDVIIKYADETGYSPAVLINRDNSSFVNAVRNLKEPLYVNTELDFDDHRAVRRREYRLRGTPDNNVPELIFYNVYMGSKGYRYVTLRYEQGTASYSVRQKGEVFDDRGER
jgi:hypothetical protein